MLIMSSLRHLWPVAVARVTILGITFITGCLSIVYTQFIGLKIFRDDAGKEQTLINVTKNYFVILISFITALINPCKLSITYDVKSMPPGDKFSVSSNGSLSSILVPNSILISNHQIYTDWLFLWFISYTAKLGDSVYIILKDLSKIPILGYGMRNYNFLFLSRKWARDKIVLTNQLLSIGANARGVGPANGVTHVSSTHTSNSNEFGNVIKWPQGSNERQIWPYQIILFPEGTVIARNTRERSDKYCRKKNLPIMKHVLIPRIRGLYLVLKKLRDSVEVVYDITTGYSDLKADEYGEDKFSLKRFYVLGKGPKMINYHIRAFYVKDIPLGEDCEDIDDVNEEDLKKFEDWLFKIWYEKDKLMDNFFNYGHFHDPLDLEEADLAKKNTVVADFKLKSALEIISPFIPALASLLLLRILWVLVKLIIWGGFV